MEFLTEYGYVGLFWGSFLAATILPIGSEGLLILMVTQDFDLSRILLFATTGNVMGAIVNYWIGYQGNRFFLKKIFRMSELEIQKAEQRFKKYGNFSMLLTWVPIIGDPLTVVAGWLKMNFSIFILLVSIGKFTRYFLIALGVQAL